MNHVTPPRLASKLFDRFCANAAVEDIHGDLDEVFYGNLEIMSVRKAKMLYWKNVISLIFSYALRKRKKAQHTSTPFSAHVGILRNYFLVATRNLARQKFFTIINVLGLSFGMSVSLLLIALVTYVSRYDTFHVNKDNIYRVTSQTQDNVRAYSLASAPTPIAEKLAHDVPGIAEIVRINKNLRVDADWNNKQIPLQGYFTEPVFFRVFTFPFVKGNPASALKKPNSVVITESAAVKMFGEEEALGKVITLGEFGDHEVTGILKDHPKNSHMTFEILASYESLLSAQRNAPPLTERARWQEFRNNYTYLLLGPGSSREKVDQYLSGLSIEESGTEGKFRASFKLQSLAAIVPGPELSNQIGPDWGFDSLAIFSVLTLLILLPACFNYTNISISRALKRAKEIGLRKVVGGQRNQIFFQFIMETVIVTLLALGGSYVIFMLIRDSFTGMLVHAAGLDLNPTLETFFYFLCFALFVGFMAGLVPALHFSRLNPIQAIRNVATLKTMRGFNLRKVLIVSQFALSLGFIMSVVIAFNQYRASVNYDFGFTRENILDVDLQGIDPDLFRNEFSQLSSVRSLSMSSSVLGTSWDGVIAVSLPGEEDSVEVAQFFIDQNYFSGMGLTLLAGKSFDGERDNANQVVVNEAFLQAFHISNPPDAIGRSFVLPDKSEVTVRGVARNFHYATLREPIRSFFFRYDPRQFRYANLTVTSSDMFTTVSAMEAGWKKIAGEKKFQARFFDDEIREAYVTYFGMMKICGFLGLMAITISCLGLLGMVVYTVETKTKELGVRKVMGASTLSLAVMLSRGYVMLMLVAAFIAIPVTYFFFDKLLMQLQYYRIGIGVRDIVISLGIMLLLGCLTVLSQTVRASRQNPVDTLRYE